MIKLTKKELQKRKADLSKQARIELSKSETMRFRLEPHNIIKLCELAEKKKQRVSTMVRQWVLDHMEAELAGISQAKSISYIEQNSSIAKTNRVAETANDNSYVLNNILQRLNTLETKIKQLTKSK